MPQDVKDAVVAAENRTFWSDSGIDYKGIVRAAFNNASGNATQGASTITQQYIKILYLTQERSYTRKLKEAILSLKLGRQVSKQEILEGYLNTIYFGRGAYGIQAAAHRLLRQAGRRALAQGERGAGEHHQQPEPLRPGQRQGLQDRAARALRLRARRHGQRRRDQRRRGGAGGQAAAEVRGGEGREHVRRPEGPRADDGEGRAAEAHTTRTASRCHRGRDRRRRPAGDHDVHQEGDGRRRGGRQRGPPRGPGPRQEPARRRGQRGGRHRSGPRHLRRPGLPRVPDQLGGGRWHGRLVAQAVRAGGRPQGGLLAQGHLRRQLALRAARRHRRGARTRATRATARRST